tara:strand:+ start:553 stop:1557 length:1005 start_codon:yes stop_codon:yes gene_type:complete
MLILGIESSCDETAAAVISNEKLLSNVVWTQKIHEIYGGVVPEIASREHGYRISLVVEKALKDANININQLDSIAVTYGAGLNGALLVGLNFAKGLSVGLNIPFIGVNHIEGHIFANLMTNNLIEYPNLCMIVTGGHTQIWLVKRVGDYKCLSDTLDDSAGEAFDKGARILGLNYPGGPEIEKNARNGDPDYYKFPIAKIKNNPYDFSFSGLKTSLLYKTKTLSKEEVKSKRPHLAASYQRTIVYTLLEKIKFIVTNQGIKNISITGGVAANQYFRHEAKILENELKAKIYFPPIKFCTDNAAMIASAGYEYLKKGMSSELSIEPNPNLSLDSK